MKKSETYDLVSKIDVIRLIKDRFYLSDDEIADMMGTMPYVTRCGKCKNADAKGGTVYCSKHHTFMNNDDFCNYVEAV